MTTAHEPIHPFMDKDTSGQAIASFSGLSKREYFSGIAMQAIVSSFTIGRYQPELQTATAESAVKYADSLIAELDKQLPSKPKKLKTRKTT